MKIKIEKGLIRLSFDFDKEKIKSCKVIGMRWNKLKRDWIFPDNYMNRWCLNCMFPGLIPQSVKVIKELTVPSFLMDHQGSALRKAVRLDRRGYFHDTGTCKTVTALEIYRHHQVKTLVVCPLSLIEGAWLEEIDNPLAWITIKESTPEIEEIRDQYRNFDTANLWSAKKKNINKFNEALKKNLCLINYESFRTIDQILARAGFEMVIMDESANIRSPKSSIAKKLIEFCDNVQYVYELSGLPAPNSMLEYWTQIRILDPIIWGKSFYKFRTKYFYPCGYGGYTWEVKKEYKDKLMDDIKTVAEHVHKKDVLDLPERTESMRVFQLSAKERQCYKDIKQELITILDNGEAITAPNAVTAIMKLRQISSGFLLNTTATEVDGRIKKKTEVFTLGDSKLKELIALLESIGPKQAIIWIEFQHEAIVISDMLDAKKLSYGILNGTVPEKQKQINLKDFKKDKLQYIICHPKSVKFGHTLVNCSESVYYSFSYSYDNLYQSGDRVYRCGQTEKCSYYYLVAAKTMELVMLKAVRAKESVSQAVLEYLKGEA